MRFALFTLSLSHGERDRVRGESLDHYAIPVPGVIPCCQSPKMFSKKLLL